MGPKMGEHVHAELGEFQLPQECGQQVVHAMVQGFAEHPEIPSCKTGEPPLEQVAQGFPRGCPGVPHLKSGDIPFPGEATGERP